MKGDDQVVVAIIIFFLGFWFGLIVEQQEVQLFMKDYLPSIVTLVAAFSGAFFAYYLQSRRQEKKVLEEKKFAGNKALFTLSRQLNQLIGLQNQVIKPTRNEPSRYLLMGSMHPVEIDNLLIDVESVSYLLETDHRQILLDLLIEEERFKSAIQALNERSKLHLHEVQPLLNKAEIRVEDVLKTDAEIEHILGHKLFVQLNTATDQVVELIDETIISMQALSGELNRALKKLFPDHIFFQIGKKAQKEYPADS